MDGPCVWAGPASAEAELNLAVIANTPTSSRPARNYLAFLIGRIPVFNCVVTLVFCIFSFL